MNLPLAIIAFGIWIFFLVGLTFLFWLKPEGFFPAKERGGYAHQEFVSMAASLLAILLFISCFLLGVWLAVAQLKGAF